MGFSSKNTGVGCHSFLQGIFSTQRSSLRLLWLLHCRQILYCSVTVGSPRAGTKCHLHPPQTLLSWRQSGEIIVEWTARRKPDCAGPWLFLLLFTELKHFKILIEEQLIYNVVLVSGVRQSDSIIHINSFSNSFPLKVVIRYWL